MERFDAIYGMDLGDLNRKLISTKDGQTDGWMRGYQGCEIRSLWRSCISVHLSGIIYLLLYITTAWSYGISIDYYLLTAIQFN